MSSVRPPGFDPPPPLPAPPGIPPPAPAARGCWRTGLIGCGIAGLVILLGIVALFMYLRRNPQAITDYVMAQVESHYGPDVTEQDKAELRQAYAEYRQRLRENKADAEPMQHMRSVFVSTGPNNTINREQVHELTAAFRRASGAPAVPSLGTPAMVPSVTPSP
jgi:hypothetical protein